MRKLFELFLSFFRPVPKDVVNTGYLSEWNVHASGKYAENRKTGLYHFKKDDGFSVQGYTHATCAWIAYQSDQAEIEYIRCAENGLCTRCGGSQKVIGWDDCPNYGGMCIHCIHADHEADGRSREGELFEAIANSKDADEAQSLYEEYEMNYGPYTGPAPEWFDHEAAVCERIEKQMSDRGDDSFCIR